MRNLAGVKDCDIVMRDELRMAEIPVVRATDDEMKHTEVPFTIAGQLGLFHFTRALYYWRVYGPMPLEKAKRLNETWGDVVRVAGMDGGDDPESWVEDGYVKSYHVYTQEGLNALTDTIRELYT